MHSVVSLSLEEIFIVPRTKLEEGYSLLITQKKNDEEKFKIISAEFESLQKAAVGFVIARVKLINDNK